MKKLMLLMCAFLLVGCTKSKKEVVEEEDNNIVATYTYDLTKDGRNETIVKMKSKNEDGLDQYEYDVYDKNGNELLHTSFDPNGEDGKLYYSDKYDAVAFSLRGSDFRFTYFYKLNDNNQVYKTIGWIDEKNKNEYKRIFFDYDGNLDIFKEDALDKAKKCKFTECVWDDNEKQVKKAEKQLEEKIGYLFEIKNADVYDKAISRFIKNFSNEYINDTLVRYKKGSIETKPITFVAVVRNQNNKTEILVGVNDEQTVYKVTLASDLKSTYREEDDLKIENNTIILSLDVTNKKGEKEIHDFKVDIEYSHNEDTPYFKVTNHETIRK